MTKKLPKFAMSTSSAAREPGAPYPYSSVIIRLLGISLSNRCEVVPHDAFNTYISLMTHDTRHLFVCLLTTHITLL